MTKRGIFTRGLTKVYTNRKRKRWLRVVREEKLAVDNLDLEIPPGQITGLIGLNGAGKTTTVKMLGTLLLPTSGQILVDGLDLGQHAQQIRRRINVIAGSERMVYYRLTGRENLWYFAQLYDINPMGLQAKISELLDLVGLSQAADQPVEQYSKGMKQRLQIARGLINDPAYLFLDEPTVGLDAPIARDIRQMMRRLADADKGLLLTSHYLMEVEELCQHIYLIDEGQLIASGSPAAIKARAYPNLVVQVLLPELPTAVSEAMQTLATETGALVEQNAEEEGVTLTIHHPEDITGRISAAIALHGGSITRLELLKPTLEDAVFALTRNQPTNRPTQKDSAATLTQT